MHFSLSRLGPDLCDVATLFFKKIAHQIHLIQNSYEIRLPRTSPYPIQSMTDLFGQTWTGQENWGSPGSTQSDWKNAPGLIRFLGPDGPQTWNHIANITKPALRGDKTLTLSR